MSLSVKRVFAQRWADMSDDDSLGEVPSAAAIKAQLAANATTTCPQPASTAPTVTSAPLLTTDTVTVTPPSHEKSTMPPPPPVKPTTAALTPDTPSTAPSTTAAATVSASLPNKPTTKSTAASTTPVVFQSKPKPGFKSWTDLARPTLPISASTTQPSVDSVCRILSFDSDDDNSRMDSLPAPPLRTAITGNALAVPSAYDPELDNSRDGLPLLLKQSTMTGSGALRRLAEDDECDGMDASMETSRDRGIKRKQAEAEAPTPRNTPVKCESTVQPKQLVTAWAAGKAAAALFSKAGSNAAETEQPQPAKVGAFDVKGEAVTKKQKVDTTQAVATKAATPRSAATCPAPLPVSIIRPVSVGGRVTRSAWKRINDAAPVPPSPTLSAINAAPPAQRKQRVVVKKKDLLGSATAAPPAAIDTTTAATTTDVSPSASTPDSPTPSTSSTATTPAPPPSPRTLARRLEQRHKQILLGKRTVGYERYRSMVAKRERVEGQHPRTPNAKRACSKRSWDGQIRKWRRELHRWDEGKSGERDDSVAVSAAGSDVECEGEEGEVSELGSEWSMRDESEVSELGSELGSELSVKRGSEEETSEMSMLEDPVLV